MTSLQLLVDNDIVIALAQMDVFDDGMLAIGVAPSRTGSLGVMLRYMGLESEANRRARTRTKDEADRLHSAIKQIQVIEPTPPEVQFAARIMRLALENELDLQHGEVALIAIAVSRIDPRFATGDKRAIRSLPDLMSHVDISALRGRIVCLEQIFKKLCRAKGIARVQKAVAASPYADDTIRLAYENLAAGGAASFIAGMEAVKKDRLDRPAPGWLCDA